MPRKAPKRRREVALLIETSNAYARGLLQGVVHYVREHQSWSFHLKEQGRGDDPPAWLENWKGDGIIARIETPRIAKAVARARLPAVDVSAARLLPSLPWLETDDTQIAALAAGHLMERGFKHFAFCGDSRFNWSLWRGEAFAVRIRTAGHDCHRYQPSASSEDLTEQVRDIARWVRTLPKPIGIMCCYDIRGRQVLDACRTADVSVPDEAAVIGVDNDELLCELSLTPLSSVIPNAQRTGYEAAALLDHLMAGQTLSTTVHRIAPLGVAARQSTDVLAMDDRAIARAVQFIREHACSGINVSDLLKTVPLSRRVLEQRFQKLLRRSPREEIQLVRLNRVKQLLTDTDLPLYEIADRTGFEHVEYLSVVFKRETKMTASSYRAKTQG
jgi:LacI family transcriptional regulator